MALSRYHGQRVSRQLSGVKQTRLSFWRVAANDPKQKWSHLAKTPSGTCISVARLGVISCPNRNPRMTWAWRAA
jgi:hypothetical protein